MAIAYDATSNSGAVSSNTSSHAHTSTGSQRSLMVCVLIETSAGAPTVSGITYNSVAMTSTVTLTEAGGNGRAEIWRLVAPTTGANNIVVTLSGSTNFVVGAMSFTGVDQSSPIEDTSTNEGTMMGGDSELIVTVTTANGWVVECLLENSANNLTVGAGQTSRMEDIAFGGWSAYMSHEGPCAAGSVTMSWTDGTTTYVTVGASLKPYVAPTRLYLPFSSTATPISPAFSASWDFQADDFARARASTTKISSAFNAAAHEDSDSTDLAMVARQHISPPTTAGQTISGTVKAQLSCQQGAADENIFLALCIRVLASDGSTVRATLLDVTLDNTEMATAAPTNRQFASIAITSYSPTVAGDRIVIETGGSGDPTGAGVHVFAILYGDASGTDLPEDDTDTNDYNPWVEFSGTITFEAEGDIPVFAHHYMQMNGSR